ncbi:hypothetical protein [Oceanobacillus indicireducens]|uniref:Uncharacterized protein n=1 Tax=Oceanobacillus indicireducens TaxID=1004261 RepID=A0A918D546_9BACI|nr:hypothetical protein [Oceanobacillus indicireducens]GGN66434.1 hypothetical protein GCM10007971_36430 [Oceanobacillus indicireducens]
MEKKEMTVYIAKDGKKFFSEEQAKRHEEMLSNTKAYKVFYSPDLTETGNLGKVGYLIVQANWSHDLWAEYWLYSKFGNRIDFVQGVAPTKNWTFQKVDLDEVDHGKLLASIKK